MWCVRESFLKILNWVSSSKHPLCTFQSEIFERIYSGVILQNTLYTNHNKLQTKKYFSRILFAGKISRQFLFLRKRQFVCSSNWTRIPHFRAGNPRNMTNKLFLQIFCRNTLLYCTAVLATLFFSGCESEKPEE